MDSDWDVWVPIPTYAELKVNLALLKSERAEITKNRDAAADAFLFTSFANREKAISEGRNADQARVLMKQTRAIARMHEEDHEEELKIVEKLTAQTHTDMWDHKSMAEQGRPSSGKRLRHFLSACGSFPSWYAARWAYEHLPVDVLAERRARALERWRKGAYLLGLLTFWKRVTSAPNSKAARAALDRVAAHQAKRARVHEE